MSDRHNIKSELEQLSPYLAKLKSQERLKPQVPDAYFESLPDEVLIRARAEEGLVHRTPHRQKRARKESTGWSWLFNWQPALRLASILLLLALAAYLFYPSGTSAPSGELAAIEQLEEEDINEYITHNISEFDVALMLEAELVDQVSLEGILSEGLPDEVLDEYLDDLLEDMDLQDMEEVL